MRFDPGHARGARLAHRPRETVAGALAGIRFHKDGFLIGSLDCGATIKGSMPNAQVGMRYELEGRWEKHPQYGRQFHFDSYRTDYPRDNEAIRAYLEENAKWVGREISRRLVEAYGPETLQVCKADPERVAREIRGITPERAGEIAGMLREIERGEALGLALKEIFAGTRVPRRAVGRMVEKWGSEAPDRVRANPFALVDEIEGIGFLLADEVARKLGYARDGEPRVRAGLVHALKEAAGGEGHTCLPEAALVVRAKKLLGVGDAKVREVLGAAVASGLLAESGGRLYLPKMLDAERRIAAKLREIMAAPSAGAVPSFDGLMADQVEALRKGTGSTVFILTGAPGTGKSHSCKAIIQSFPNARIELAAPTGKASKRIYEQTGRLARTIHKLLEPVHDDGEFQFTRDAEFPIEADLIILDEMSMVDVRLFASFLEAVKPGTRLVLVGDTYQLPSVGPGNVLKDLIASGAVPCQELTVIKRQEPGLIITNSHRIKAGQDIEVRNGPGSDFFFLSRATEAEIRDTVLDLVRTRLPATYGVDRLRDIQVITPLREKTSLSCKGLNAVFQEALNPAPLPNGSRFKPGDKVINKKNNYQLDIINGDIGYVRDVDPKDDTIVVDFENPDRRVELSLRDNDLHLAYAITCHSFQGSEAPIIVIPIHRCFGSLIMQRNWLYTAVSRAQKVCVLVGQREEVRKTIRRNKQQKRFTGLEGFLRNGHA